jgi:hypothetical protein
MQVPCGDFVVVIAIGVIFNVLSPLVPFIQRLMYSGKQMVQ